MFVFIHKGWTLIRHFSEIFQIILFGLVIFRFICGKLLLRENNAVKNIVRVLCEIQTFSLGALCFNRFLYHNCYTTAFVLSFIWNMLLLTLSFVVLPLRKYQLIEFYFSYKLFYININRKKFCQGVFYKGRLCVWY